VFVKRKKNECSVWMEVWVLMGLDGNTCMGSTKILLSNMARPPNLLHAPSIQFMPNDNTCNNLSMEGEDYVDVCDQGDDLLESDEMRWIVWERPLVLIRA
jgi:hypothetical protein